MARYSPAVKLCLVEDDLDLGKGLAAALRDAGYEVAWVRRVADAWRLIPDSSTDIVVLDLGLPDGDGIDLLRRLRTARSDLPVLIVTSRDALADRVEGLDAGADDYLTKPFDVPELLARLRAVTRRSSPSGTDGAEHLWRLRDVTIDELRHTVMRGPHELSLSPSEYALLLMLVRNSHRVLTRQELERRALGDNEGHTLDVHMSNLRRKLGQDYIRTVRGVGYAVIA